MDRRGPDEGPKGERGRGGQSPESRPMKMKQTNRRTPRLRSLRRPKKKQATRLRRWRQSSSILGTEAKSPTRAGIVKKTKNQDTMRRGRCDLARDQLLCWSDARTTKWSVLCRFSLTFTGACHWDSGVAPSRGCPRASNGLGAEMNLLLNIFWKPSPVATVCFPALACLLHSYSPALPVASA